MPRPLPMDIGASRRCRRLLKSVTIRWSHPRTVAAALIGSDDAHGAALS
jgi:hypothetical protein